MREKIAEVLHEWYYHEIHEAVADAGLITLSWEIINLLKQEIEGVENPESDRYSGFCGEWTGFEDCRQAILERLK